jgi:hypothetical protein
MPQPTYVYEGKIDRGQGAIRLAQLLAEAAPVLFGGSRHDRQALRAGPGDNQRTAGGDTRLQQVQ